MGEYDWHIGGFGFDAVEVIDTYMNGEYSFVGDNGREMGLS